MKVRVMKSILMAAAILGLAAITGIVAYTVQNDSGHTGFSPYLGLAVFVPVALAGLFQIFFLRTPRAARRWGVIALLAGVIGIALLVYLDKSNTLLEYGDWCSRGMP